MPSPESITNKSTITLQIGSHKLSGFEGLQVVRAIDSAADAYSFSIPWNPDIPENREWFKPFSPQVVKIHVDDELLLTGYIEKHDFRTESGGRSLNIQGRSASGAIIDWSAGPPFQFENISFNNFGREMWGSVGGDVKKEVEQVLDVTAEGQKVIQEISTLTGGSVALAYPDTKPIGEINIDIGQTHYEIISRLASVHGLWACPTPGGNIVYRILDSQQNPFATLVEGSGPVKSVSARYDITKRFQKYMVIGTYEGQDASAEVSDPETFGLAIRGRQISELSQQTTDIDMAAKFARSKALIESFSATVTVDGWRYNGKLWTPGKILALYAPGAYIIRKYARLMMSRITFQIDESGGLITSVDLALPQAWDNSEINPGELPWAG